MLFRFVRSIVGGVLGDLGRQMNIVQELAHKPMQMMVQQVVGGVWVGKGADAFVQEVSNIMMPNTNTIAQTIGQTAKNIQRAIDVMDNCDRQVRSKANALSDIFGGIAGGL